MEAILEDMELFLTDLLQTGIATADPKAVRTAETLARRAEETGMHTGADLFQTIAQGLRQRQHQLEKADRSLTLAVCRGSYYIELCRRRLTEENIRHRWQEGEPL